MLACWKNSLDRVAFDPNRILIGGGVIPLNCMEASQPPNNASDLSRPPEIFSRPTRPCHLPPVTEYIAAFIDRRPDWDLDLYHPDLYYYPDLSPWDLRSRYPFSLFSLSGNNLFHQFCEPNLTDKVMFYWDNGILIRLHLLLLQLLLVLVWEKETAILLLFACAPALAPAPSLLSSVRFYTPPSPVSRAML